MNDGWKLYEKAKRMIPGGTQLLSKRPEMYLPESWPCYYTHAKGAKVRGVDGKWYYDFTTCGLGAHPLGYSDSSINAAAIRAAVSGNMSTLNNWAEVELIEKLCDLHPWASMGRRMLGGGEAMAAAVRIARAATGKDIILFGGYHGWHDAFLASEYIDGFHYLAGTDATGVPESLQFSAIPFPHNDPERLIELARNFNIDGIAAIVFEIQRHEKPTTAFLQALQSAKSKTGAVLICDEITSGFRLNVGGAHLLYDFEPDIAVFGKALGNGYPISAIIGNDVMKAAESTFISSTFHTERIGPAAALATIKKLEETDAIERIKEAGIRAIGIWVNAGLDYELKYWDAGEMDMPPLCHFYFKDADGNDDNALKTLYIQEMLDRGFLADCNFYPTAAHTPEIMDRFEEAINEVFPILADAQEKGDTVERLRGPVCSSRFERLTS